MYGMGSISDGSWIQQSLFMMVTFTSKVYAPKRKLGYRWYSCSWNNQNLRFHSGSAGLYLHHYRRYTWWLSKDSGYRKSGIYRQRCGWWRKEKPVDLLHQPVKWSRYIPEWSDYRALQERWRYDPSYWLMVLLLLIKEMALPRHKIHPDHPMVMRRPSDFQSNHTRSILYPVETGTVVIIHGISHSRTDSDVCECRRRIHYLS